MIFLDVSKLACAAGGMKSKEITQSWILLWYFMHMGMLWFLFLSESYVVINVMRYIFHRLTRKCECAQGYAFYILTEDIFWAGNIKMSGVCVEI